MVNGDGVLRRKIVKNKEMTRRYRNLKSQNFFIYYHYVLKYNTPLSEDSTGPRLQAYFFQNNCHYRGADKSLVRPGRKQATSTEDFDFHIPYL